MTTQCFKRNLLLYLYREENKYRVCFLLPLKRDKKCLTLAAYFLCLETPGLPAYYPLNIRWPKYWSFSFSISLSNESSGLISFSIDRFELLVVQVTLKSLLQHHISKASFLQCSTFFMVQLSHLYVTTGKTIDLTI